MQVSVRNLQKKYKIEREKIEKMMLKLMKKFGIVKGELSVAFVSFSKMKELNRNLRGVDAPTDVLSYLLEEEPFLGEVIVCPEVANSQAKEIGHSFEKELALLLIHGFLHLLGYDHKSQGDLQKMEMLQKNLLEELVGETV